MAIDRVSDVIDDQFARIMDTLEQSGQLDNTVVIFTSDNGYICGSHGYGSKVLPMEESSRVPLMIYDPRSPLTGKELRCDRLTGNIDFAPTILELAGLPIPSNMDGKSLLGLLKEPNKGGHDQMAFINVYGPLPQNSGNADPSASPPCAGSSTPRLHLQGSV